MWIDGIYTYLYSLFCKQIFKGDWRLQPQSIWELWTSGLLQDEVKIPNRRFGTDIPETSLRNYNYSLPCVIAQQYSSATFVFLRFHSCSKI